MDLCVLSLLVKAENGVELTALCLHPFYESSLGLGAVLRNELINQCQLVEWL